MWKFEHSVTTEAKAETIWGLYSNIDTWKEWDEFVHVELFDEFKEGTKGTLQPRGRDALAYMIVEVKPLRSFSDITHMPAAGISISFSHDIDSKENGTRVTHTMTITGPNAETLGPQIGGEISQRIPHTAQSFVRLARKIELEAV